MSIDFLRSLIRHAWASVRARPGLAATVTLSLAVGLGANALLFAVVDGAILRPFPFPEPDRLVGIGAGFPKINRPLGFFETLSGPEYLDIRTVSSLTRVVAGGQRYLAAWLYGTTPEAAPLTLVSAVVLIVSLAASAWPIIRAMRLSPMVALTRR